MTLRNVGFIALFIAAVAIVGVSQWRQLSQQPIDDPREEVIFWHFWGGRDRQVVEDVVRRFNETNKQYRVRAVAMPGNNLDVKLFLSISGGAPPDLINQDDPLIADWAERGALTPIEEIASPAEVAELREFLFPAAVRLTEYDQKLYGVCNGLDIRALYYNKTLLQSRGYEAPTSLEALNNIATEFTERNSEGRITRFGYVPDARRLWAWGIVFGGDFYDEDSQTPTADDERIVQALRWMGGASNRLGVTTSDIQAFRQGDQSLPGKPFPLLPISPDSPHGRYALIIDGQWRVRDIMESYESRTSQNLPVAEIGVCPLPPPQGGEQNAGWVNGNYFIVPRGARQSQGAWEFMKFWIGLDGHQHQAAKTCAAGGWIPVSQRVVDDEAFQNFLNEQPLFGEFVALAASENQHPIPMTPGAPYFNREIKQVGESAMLHREASAEKLLTETNDRIKHHLERLKK